MIGPFIPFAGLIFRYRVDGALSMVSLFHCFVSLAKNLELRSSDLARQWKRQATWVGVWGTLDSSPKSMQGMGSPKYLYLIDDTRNTAKHLSSSEISIIMVYPCSINHGVRYSRFTSATGFL